MTRYQFEVWKRRKAMREKLDEKNSETLTNFSKYLYKHKYM